MGNQVNPIHRNDFKYKGVVFAGADEVYPINDDKNTEPILFFYEKNACYDVPNDNQRKRNETGFAPYFSPLKDAINNKSNNKVAGKNKE